jgi:hypothetical protein
MARMTKREQYRAYVEQWRRAGPELERFHAEELRRYRYDPADADTALEMGDYYDGPPRLTSGMIEMQRKFMELARKQGLLPAVREESAVYGSPLVCYNNAALPPGPKLALLCSVRCPGKLILETYDLTQQLRKAGVIVVSGFHSPMEKECLNILLRSPNPVIWCLARGMVKVIPRELSRAVHEGRLLVVSPFPGKVRHVTAQTAMKRNRFVADMASAVIVPHAAAGSKMAALCREVLVSGKSLYTFDHPANIALLKAGARAVTPDTDWKQVLK